MNICEAIKELSEARCEGIKLGDFKISMYQTNTNFKAGSFILSLEKLLSEEWQLINDKPIFEEVEIVKWFWINNEGVEHYATEKPFGAYSNLAIKLTGTIKKEIKPKVNKREEVEQLFLGNMAGPLSAPYRYKGRNVKLFAEWVE